MRYMGEKLKTDLPEPRTCTRSRVCSADFANRTVRMEDVSDALIKRSPSVAREIDFVTLQRHRVYQYEAAAKRAMSETETHSSQLPAVHGGEQFWRGLKGV